MSDPQRIQLREVGDVTVVRFVDHKIIDTGSIQQLVQELFSLVEEDNRGKLVLNFSDVDFLSSAALNKLIVLDRKVKGAGGKLKLSDLKPEIVEVFHITRLSQLFDIRDSEADALNSF